MKVRIFGDTLAPEFPRAWIRIYSKTQFLDVIWEPFLEICWAHRHIKQHMDIVIEIEQEDSMPVSKEEDRQIITTIVNYANNPNINDYINIHVNIA